MYRHLNSDKIVNTLELLERRIKERFSNAGLTKVGGGTSENRAGRQRTFPLGS